MPRRVNYSPSMGLRRGQRRATEWIGSADSTAVSSLAAGAGVLNQSFAFSAEPATVVRTRGSLWVASDQVAATEEPFGALGFIVVRDAAFSAGVASIPTPITEEGDDGWFLWQAFLASFQAGGGTYTGDVNQYVRYDFDSKAQRKVQDGDTVVVMLENASSTAGLSYFIKFRMLVKLHA